MFDSYHTLNYFFFVKFRTCQTTNQSKHKTASCLGVNSQIMNFILRYPFDFWEFKFSINIITEMGNYNCCSESKQNRNSIKIKSIRTTVSLDCKSDQEDKKNLIQEFTQNFAQSLEHLQRNKGNFHFSPSCFNVTLESKIGKGAHSDVYLVKTDYQTNFMQMALKIIPKQKLKSSSLRKSAAMENLLLSKNTSPFLIKSYMSRQDENNIYYFSPIAHGGDLISFTNDNSVKGTIFEKPDEDNVRFVLAGIILGLEYLHKLGIVLNDLKLENILIDKEGYPLINDFGLIEPENTDYFEQVIGTITYFSPQKLHSSKYNRAVDFWALGVLIYALVYKEYPFEKQLIQCGNFLTEVRAKQGKHKKMSSKGSDQLKDLINNLLLEDPDQRLGTLNIDDLKEHSFFSSINWVEYQNKTLKSPLKQVIEKCPLKNAAEEITTGNVKIFRQSHIEDEFLFNIESTLKLKRSLCSTVDRLSNQCSSENISPNHLYKTVSLAPRPKTPKNRKKSVSFGVGV